MELTEIRKLVRLMLRADLSELEIDDSNRGLRVHIKRGTGGGGHSAGVAPVVQIVPTPAGGPAATVTPGTEAASLADVLEEGEAPAGTEFVASPMVGTFYRAPAPDAEPFVEVGGQVSEDTVLCIIEAMKVMNEIKAEMKGEILEALVESGEPVEFGQPLFLIKKG